MEVKCIAVAGSWKYKYDGLTWEFEYDPKWMSINVHFDKRVTLNELRKLVLRDFSVDSNLMTVTLSYLSPAFDTIVNGKKPPPVVLTTDSSLRTFCRHLLSRKINVLYVSFIVSENQSTIVTPIVGTKRKSTTNDVGSSYDPDVGEVCVVNDDFFVAVAAIEDTMFSSSKTPAPQPQSGITPVEQLPIAGTPIKQTRFIGTPIKQPCFNETPVSHATRFVEIPVSQSSLVNAEIAQPSIVSCPVPQTNLDKTPLPKPPSLKIHASQHTVFQPCLGETPVSHASRLVEIQVSEAAIVGSYPVTQPNLDSPPLSQPNRETDVAQPDCDLHDEEEISDSSLDSIDIEDIDVRSRGYDEDFWGPMLDDKFGGSNAIDIMLGEKVNFDHGLVDVEMHDVAISQYDLLKHGPRKDTWGCCNMDTDSSSRIMLNRSQASKSDRGQESAPCVLTCGQTSATGTLNYSQRSAPAALNGGQSSSSRSLKRVHFSASMNANSSNGGLDTDIDLENDLPPMFDDTQYENYMIPDLNFDDGDETIDIGKTFINKSECQIALAIYAIRNMFYFKQSRTTKSYFVVTCADQQCRWRVSAHQIKDSAYYIIKKATLSHSCGIDTRSKYTKMATARVIAHVFKSKFGVTTTGPTAKELQRLVLEELRVSTTYSKCWRANQAANEDIRGTEEDSYLKLEEYLYMLNLANPGSKTDIKTVTDEDGVERFMYLFLAFGASITGFKELRSVLVLDGTHLSGKYKGVLLTASGQDANFQVFPLAFAVVDSENDASWHWFLTKVNEIVEDSPSLSIISDRHQSIKKASKSVFKSAKHGACIVHLARNVITKFKSKGLATEVMKAACAYQIKHFKKVFAKIRATSARCAKFLEKVGFQHWSRAYFQGKRYNLMTSNIAETLNNTLRSARRSTIIELLMFIQSMLMRWFSQRSAKSISHKAYTTPEVDKLIQSTLAKKKGSEVTSVSTWSSEVQGLFGERHLVQLSEKKCTCKVYDVLKIPCGHALLAADNKKLQYGQLVGDKYKTSAWQMTYAGVIKPNEDAGNVDIPEAIRSRSIQPPKVKRPCGRPKVNRYLSTGEIPEGKKLKKCGRCGGMGHNKISCKNPI